MRKDKQQHTKVRKQWSYVSRGWGLQTKHREWGWELPEGGRIAILKEAVRARPFWEGDIWTNWRWQGTRLWEGKAVKNKTGAKALRQEHTYVLKKELGIWCRWEDKGCSQVPQNHLEGSLSPCGSGLTGPTTSNLSPTPGFFFLWMSYLPHHPIMLVSRIFF